jgi:hypothetical protein
MAKRNNEQVNGEVKNETPAKPKPADISLTNDKVEMIATKEGATLKSNKWKEGTKFSCHPNLAEHFEKKGWAKKA